MRDINLSQEKKDRILSWIFVLVMRLYGQNVYNDESYIWGVLDLDSLDDIDNFFENVLGEFKMKHQDIAKLYKIIQKTEDILSR